MRMQVSLIYKSEIIYILGSKYDNIFAFGEILKKERIIPKLVRNGNRLYNMKVAGKGLTPTSFRDSYDTK
jgi:hypothetical protein